MFAIFINDLASEIKNSNIGIILNETLTINILLYADDIVLLAKNEEDLQDLLFIVEGWCKKWRLEINLTKTNIMHIRSNRKQQSKFMFIFDMQPVPYCTVYKYLGANINEFLDYNFTATCLAESAGRALSSVITKMIKNGGFPFNVYTVLYDACVTSISDYASEITGFTQYQPTLDLHTRAIRAFLGLPKNSCNVGVLSEVDWLLPEYRTQCKMIRQYSRILNMDNSRLTKRVYLWDKSLNDENIISSWCSEVKSVLSSCELTSVYETGRAFPLACTLEKMKQKFRIDQAQYLKAECEQMPKLRTFMTFKQFDKLPAYVTKPLSFFQRKALSKIRLGSLELRIESGRFARPRLQVHERVCLLCRDRNQADGLELSVETEFHFIYVCTHFNTLRSSWLESLVKPENFDYLSDGEKLSVALNEAQNVKSTAQFITRAYSMRSNVINK